MAVSESFKNTISAHLNDLATKDELFAVTLKKTNKNIEECCNYILQEVQKSGKMGFDDAEIFGMAVHYYDEDSIKDIKPQGATVKVNHSVDAPKKEPVKATVATKPVVKPVAKPMVKTVVKQKASKAKTVVAHQTKSEPANKFGQTSLF